MFKGIITGIGVLQSITQNVNQDSLAAIKSLDPMYFCDTKIGDSVSCAGVCLTAISVKNDEIAVEISNETMKISNSKNWKVGTELNLELAMRLSDRIDGHLIQGHVDGIGLIKQIVPIDSSHEILIEVSDKNLLPFIVRKGAIAVDGVSLTINDVMYETHINTCLKAVDEVIPEETKHQLCNIIKINIIPHTWEHTTMHNLCESDIVNIEIDIIARYVNSFDRKFNLS